MINRSITFLGSRTRILPYLEVDWETPLAHEGGETGVVTETLYAELGGAEGLKRGDKLHASCVVLHKEREKVVTDVI